MDAHTVALSVRMSNFYYYIFDILYYFHVYFFIILHVIILYSHYRTLSES